MSIKFACDCGKAYKVPEKFAGKRVKCKQCGEPIRVPSESVSGVSSTRAAQVSKRSVLASQRLDGAASAKSKRMSAKLEKAGSGRTSSKSRRASKTSDRSAGKSKRVKRPGGGTDSYQAVDLSEGNQLKVFQRKKAEDFGKGEGRLTYFEGGKPRKAFKLNKSKEMMIGRDSDCNVHIDVPSLSGKHLKVEYKLGVFIATDQQSTNGLIVNGRTVRRSSLRDGDVLQLGEAIIRIDCG
jgi:FHA domain